jgi:phosphoglycolate phosphatase
MQKKLIVFDFDGTLADIEPIFLKVYAVVAERYKLPAITEEELPALRSIGAKEFITDRLKISFWKLPFVLRSAMAEYKKYRSEIQMFPGAKECIEALKQVGIRVGVLSSNDVKNIQEILNRTEIQVDFIQHSSLFGKAKSLTKILKEEGCSANDMWYIGDELRDIEACQKAGVPIVSVSWGLNSPELLQQHTEYVVSTFTELSKIL